MFDYVAYLAAQQQTLAHTQEASPDAPARSLPVVARVVVRPMLVRHQVSAVLRRLADIIEPGPECSAPAAGPC
jgi:hypothetical protein